MIDTATQTRPAPAHRLGITMTDADAIACLADETQTEPQHPVRWVPRWHEIRANEVRSREHLAVLIGSLRQPGDFAGIDKVTRGVRRWAQVMQTGASYIVELADGTEHDFARRAYRGNEGDYITGDEDGPSDCESWTSMPAADLIWAWLQGRLPRGTGRTLEYLTHARQRELGCRVDEPATDDARED